MIIKLSTNEISDIRSLIHRYSKADIKLLELENNLKKIEEEKSKLMECVNDIKIDEFRFLEFLKTKYGTGELDLQNLEYNANK